MSGRLHRAACLAAAIMLAATLACGDDSTGPEKTEGVYALRTIGDKPLPAIIAQDATEKTELTSGSITLDPNGAFTLTLAFRRTVGLQEFTSSGTSNGTWTRSGSTVTMQTSNGAVVSGALSGTTITVNMPVAQGGVSAWVFRK